MATSLAQQDDERAPEPFDLHTAEFLGDLTETPVVASSEASDEDNVNCDSGNGRDLNYYLPLYKAARENDWEKARSFFEGDPDAVTSRISIYGNTALHVAACAGHSRFVEEMVNRMSRDDLAIQGDYGRTALHYAALAGNIKAAQAMIRINSALTQIPDEDGWMPVYSASNYSSPGQREILWYLCRVSRDEDPSPFRGPLGAELIVKITNTGYYDICLFMLQRYPHLAIAQTEDSSCMLTAIAQWPSRFPSGSQLGFWQRLVYSCIPVELEDASRSAIRGDMENPPIRSGDLTSRGDMFQFLSPTYLTQAPGIKQLQETKLTHLRTMELLQRICVEISRMGNSEIYEYFKKTDILNTAAEYGTVELLTMCIQSFPDILWIRTDNGRTIFHSAIENRCEKVFNLIYGLNGEKNLLAVYTVERDNNILHLAAKLAPSLQLNSVSGEALQMQRELQWYKEVENIIEPFNREVQNDDGKSPSVIFTEEHKSLVEKGEKWMKDTAQSCMVVATLIATVVFAAAFTVPGGNISDINNSQNGIPIFLNSSSFMLFAISDALALFSSSTSVLMFLSILTSRYAEEDFLKSLPKKLIIGLATLFFSIASMMIAFSAALSIVLGHKLAWVSIPIAIFACVPVTVFALLQFPLFVQIYHSTYGSSIFQSKRKLF